MARNENANHPAEGAANEPHRRNYCSSETVYINRGLGMYGDTRK